jgi:hypothetical protein
MPLATQKSKIGLSTAAGLTLLLLLKTAVLLSNSYVYGRMAMPPVYDDVSYFVDALQRVDVFRAEGMRGVVDGLISSPPHSPYATLAAFAGFLVSGSARPAPYVVNALAIVVLTLLWLVFFRAGPLMAWIIAITIISTGWFDDAVTIFHPDLIAGYGAAIVASLAIFQYEVLTTSRRRLVAGAVAGLVLLIKPTALAMVLTLWGVAFVVGALASRALGETLLASLRRFRVPFLLIAVIAGPYFAHELLPLIRYNYLGFVTQRNTWIHLSAGANPWTFYIFSTAALFGVWLYFGAAVFVVVAGAAVRGSRVTLICFGGLLACLFILYIVPTLIPIQVMVYGGVLYGMVLVTGLVAVTRLKIFLPLIERMSGNSRTAAATLLLVAFGIVAVFQTKDRQNRFPPATINECAADYERIYSILREIAVRPAASGSASRRVSAYFPTVAVAPHAYRFRGLQEGLDININLTPHETDPERVIGSARKADVIFIPDGRLLTKYYPYPVNAILNDVVQRLRKDATMIESAPVELPDGAMLVFRPRPA